MAVPKRRVYTVLSAGLIAISLAAIFIRYAHAPGVVVAFYRMAIASLVLLVLNRGKLERSKLKPRTLGLSILSGFFLAIHFASWISSLSYTSVAASVSLVSSQPLWVVLFSWLFLKLKPRPLTFFAVILAVSGGILIALGDFSGASAPLLGNSLAIIGAISYAAYLLLGRVIQQEVPLTSYVLLAYGSAALFLLPLPFIFKYSYFAYPSSTFLWVALLALVPQLVGHTSINYAMKYLNPNLVATAVLLEPVGASIFALVLFKEIPSLQTVFGAAILLTGVILTVRSSEATG